MTGLTKDLIFVFSYVALERSSIYCDGEDGIHILSNKLTSVLSDYQDVLFVVAGDLYARVHDLQDFIPDDDADHVYNYQTNYPSTSFDMPRNNKHKHINKFGHSLIDLCCTHDIHIANGRLDADKDGNYTCTANEGKSVDDYILLSPSLFNCVSEFCICDDDFSDHFPVRCKLSFGTANNLSKTGQTKPTIINYSTYRWNESHRATFIETLTRFYDSFYESVTNDNALLKLTEFMSLLTKAGDSMKVSSSNRIGPTINQPPWWDKHCESAKRVRYKSLRQFRLTNAQHDLDLYLTNK